MSTITLSMASGFLCTLPGKRSGFPLQKTRKLPREKIAKVQGLSSVIDSILVPFIMAMYRLAFPKGGNRPLAGEKSRSRAMQGMR
ncbi:MAG: hypothetical protein A2Z26_03620 [Deltaproteobacteria bacterium RBG_16_66_15]|nr:MAG: hypothetical protein A2Z26_03620 [Deltaproteobacteria bacterium RBG_16_66_15]